VAIMMALETPQRMQAIHRHGLRPSLTAMGPATREPRNAPRVMREEMSCWTPVLMFQPMGVDGSGWPKTY
jgi:hypothetical protein